MRVLHTSFGVFDTEAGVQGDEQVLHGHGVVDPRRPVGHSLHDKNGLYEQQPLHCAVVLHFQERVGDS